MQKILVFDPGESTGWLYAEVSTSGHINKLRGGTLPKNHRSFVYLLEEFDPDVVVYETFQLYPGMAKTMSWNTMYPCEVIGVIHYLYDESCEVVGLQPSVKKFAGGFDKTWELFVAECKSYVDKDEFNPKQYDKITEHTRDTYLLLKYYLRNRK